MNNSMNKSNKTDISVGMDMALSSKPSVNSKFVFEPKRVVSIHSGKSIIFNVEQISEFIRDTLLESDGRIYRDSIVLSLQNYGLSDSQIDQVFGYGINNKLFSVSDNNKIVKLLDSHTKNNNHSINQASEPSISSKSESLDESSKLDNSSNIISYSKYQESLLVEEKLTYKQRKALPTEVFAWPEKRKYPIHDISHARNAMVRLNAAYKKGQITKQEYHKIRDKILKAYSAFGIKAKRPPIGVIEISKHEQVKRGNKARKLLKMAAEK